MLARLGKLLLILLAAAIIVGVFGGILDLAFDLIGVLIRVAVVVCIVVGALYLLGAIRKPARASRW